MGSYDVFSLPFRMNDLSQQEESWYAVFKVSSGINVILMQIGTEQ